MKKDTYAINGKEVSKEEFISKANEVFGHPTVDIDEDNEDTCSCTDLTYEDRMLSVMEDKKEALNFILTAILDKANIEEDIQDNPFFMDTVVALETEYKKVNKQIKKLK